MQSQLPPSYGQPSHTPPAGNRIPASTAAPFPSLDLLGTTDFADLGGEPLYIGSALMGTKSVQPCKVAPHLSPVCRVPYGGGSARRVSYDGVAWVVRRQRGAHTDATLDWHLPLPAAQGRYDILPITSAMEWVHASNGELPKGRRPVEGGFEEDGNHLFHALVPVREHEIMVPGKTGPHLHAAHAAWGGGELVVKEGYQILCWR
ncbi:hypothetical protein P7C70_g8234, partial [Phenoliferia sp. Uapishka_3]